MKKLFWLIIIIALAYYGYNNWIPDNPTEEIKEETETVQQDPNEWITHSNNSYANYSIQYPGDWSIDQGEGQTVFYSADNIDDVTISLQSSISNINGTQTIKDISGRQVLIIEGEDPNDGSPAKFILFNLSNEKKLEVRGFGSIFDKMVNTLVINSDQPIIEEEKTEEAIEDEKIIEDIEEENSEEEIANNETAEIPESIEKPSTPNEEFVVKVYYQKDPGDNCGSVVGVIKEIDTRYNTEEVNALVTLTLGLSQEEINQGYTTSIPYGARLRNLEITSGIATVDFNSTLNEGGGSCNMAARRAQITETLMQFPDIEQVIITVDGSEEMALQP